MANKKTKTNIKELEKTIYDLQDQIKNLHLELMIERAYRIDDNLKAINEML
ncbi:hypothetical protein [Psychrobacillus sp. BM2]|uniref:hypothetical protein n=1 Tax=Psychrobacillus sp. BM2 TaxID=3400421 RepID=UPI003B027F08